MNPGRRFFACPMNDSVCGFIGWLDPLMCARSKAIIPGLLRNLNSVQERCNELVTSMNMLQDQCNELICRNNMLVANCKALKDGNLKLKICLSYCWGRKPPTITAEGADDDAEDHQQVRSSAAVAIVRAAFDEGGVLSSLAAASRRLPPRSGCVGCVVHFRPTFGCVLQ
ncbi:unnamed protein product [Lactuca virosa]|uniref:Zinc finger GRF-type domain-containing protein n=1 Tax=Lactuca virosa TaxID=75947 RepID=A0AAU9NJ57_9ASTR|nr:unnamed protein product [Lactuca virosa]